MQMATARRQDAFAQWMRTGRWPTARTADGIEQKFNPNHDPDTGRFTSGDGDQRWGDGGFTGGGGGSAGGAGASGSGWSDRAKRPAARTTPAPVRSDASRAAGAGHDTNSPETQSPSSPRTGEEEYRHVVRNGYAYDIDPSDRTRRVSGYLTLGDGGRSRTAQARAGGADRLPSDDGGHCVAVRFNGPKEAFNHFAHDSSINRGGYRRLEDQWARSKKSGASVRVKIAPSYSGSSRRPSSINIWFWTDGVVQSDNIPNGPKGSHRAK